MDSRTTKKRRSEKLHKMAGAKPAWSRTRVLKAPSTDKLDLIPKRATKNRKNKDITVSEAGEMWLQACARGFNGREPVEHTTLVTYRRGLKKHIVPLIGNIPLSKLTTPIVAQFRDDLLEQ